MKRTTLPVAKRHTQRAHRHFTLIELLVVIVIIGIVLTLVMAPFDKLTNVAGVDGGAAQISTQIRACRQHAISKRARVALVFYSNGTIQAIRPAQLDKANSFDQWVPNSSWTYMLTGAVVEQIYNGEDVTFTGNADELLPLWDNSADVDLETFIFKPTGKLANTDHPKVHISDAIWNGSGYSPRGTGDNWQEVEVNRFTGRVEISGP